MKRSDNEMTNRVLTIEEVRLISDLRIMHSKVDELFHIVSSLKRRHSDPAIHFFADQVVLGEDIDRVDEIYLWFLQLKAERDRRPLLKSSSR